MILCPNCLHKELVGAIFCNECGAQLVFSEGVPTGSIRSTSEGLPDNRHKVMADEKTTTPPTTLLEAKVSLNIVNSGEILPLKSQKEITLGRISGGQTIIPDIDLTPYRAYEGGVSRMHASIRISNDEVSITDLGSANGTRINGRMITSHISYPIKHGDILTLGKFKIQVLLRNN